MKKLLVAFVFCVPVLHAQIRLPKLVSDSMVLQRDHPLVIWGWASPGERVRVSFNGKSSTAVTAADGLWSLMLPSMPAGGPYKMELDGKNHIEVNEVLIGDVWLCSGQSNMVLPMERVKEKYPEEIAAARLPQIRNFFIPTQADVTKEDNDLPDGHWKAASPQSVLAFGAASWFFAKRIYERYHVPIGLINSSVGGTPIEAWISETGLRDFPQDLAVIARFRDTATINGMARSQHINAQEKAATLIDAGMTGPVKWFDPAYRPVQWRHLFVPGYWADQGVKNLNGVVWFRKEIIVPAGDEGLPAKLFAGRIVDADQTWINGKLVGGITYQYPPRRYEVPAGILHAGKNLITVRITNTAGKGGFVPDKRYELVIGNDHIDIRGDWEYRVGEVFENRRTRIAVNEGLPAAQNAPSGLYNPMIAPMINYTIKGVLWYQGEANASRPAEYEGLLRALIVDWRVKWKEPALPFIYVQLPNYMDVQYSPSESEWATLRESQRKVLGTPNTGMAVTIDIGEWNDIHPLDKKDVGDRLALLAEKSVYGDSNLVASGPMIKSAERRGNGVVLSFTDTGGGLKAKPWQGSEDLNYFSIAGADGRWIWAKARIEKDRVVVWNDSVSRPVNVRYAWADNPEGANLYNLEGLPASPFQITIDQ